MVKQIFLSLLMLLLLAYLVVALTVFNRKPTGEVCKDLQLVIKDTVRDGFITYKELITLLEKKGINPVGRPMDRIHTRTLENEIARHPLVDHAECYKTLSGKLCVALTQRIPILHVMSNNGDDYYIDNKGTVMPSNAGCIARLPVATGAIEKSFAMEELCRFALFLHQHSFWNAQIEQIHVLPDRSVELVPRVGDHLIDMGSLNDYERKLSRLHTFYTRALNRIGWHRYSHIRVDFDNHIIATRRSRVTN